MAKRALLSYSDRLQLRLVTSPPTISATGTPEAGFPVSNLQDAQIHTMWRSPTGGPHTVTFDYGVGKERFDLVMLLNPPGYDMGSTPTVTLTDNLGGPHLFTSTVSVRPPTGMPERRVFVMPSQITARYLLVSISTGGYLGYVRHGWAMNVTRYATKPKNVRFVDPAVVQEQSLGAVFYLTTDKTVGRRWLAYDVTLEGVPQPTVDRDAVESLTSASLSPKGSLSGMFHRCGKVDPIVYLPLAEDDTSKATNIDIMHALAMYGRLTNDLEFKHQGTAGSVLDDLGVAQTDVELRSVELKWEALI